MVDHVIAHLRDPAATPSLNGILPSRRTDEAPADLLAQQDHVAVSAPDRRDERIEPVPAIVHAVAFAEDELDLRRRNIETGDLCKTGFKMVGGIAKRNHDGEITACRRRGPDRRWIDRRSCPDRIEARATREIGAKAMKLPAQAVYDSPVARLLQPRTCPVMARQTFTSLLQIRLIAGPVHAVEKRRWREVNSRAIRE